MFFRGKPKYSLSDIELINLYKKKDDQLIIEEFFNRYSHLVFGICYKYLHNTDDSKDAVMEIFVQLKKLLKVNEIHNFKSWLYSVTKNYCLMKLRADSKKPNIPLPDDEENETDFMEFPEFLHHINGSQEDQEIEHLEKLLELLDEGQKVCIKMFFLQNKSYKDINEVTGYTLKEVKSYIQNGKRNLKIKLEEYRLKNQNFLEIK